MRPVLTPEAHRPTENATPSVNVAPELRSSLLGLARLALAVATGGVGASALDRALAKAPDGNTLGGVFVTLTEGGALRGCIGNLEPDRPLRNAVVMAALGAALDDPRFVPVSAAELPLIRIDISVLGAPVLLADPQAFQPGVDGVIVERGGRRALLLPEVATEFSWGAPEMFEAVSRKAGLPADAWRDRETTLRTFRTTRFGGPAMTTH
jgi:AmmeMemoRadiSam system protein A